MFVKDAAALPVYEAARWLPNALELVDSCGGVVLTGDDDIPKYVITKVDEVEEAD